MKIGNINKSVIFNCRFCTIGFFGTKNAADLCKFCDQKCKNKGREKRDCDGIVVGEGVPALPKRSVQICRRGGRPRPPEKVCRKLNGRARRPPLRIGYSKLNFCEIKREGETSDGAVPLYLLRRHFPHLMGESSSPTDYRFSFCEAPELVYSSTTNTTFSSFLISSASACFIFSTISSIPRLPCFALLGATI